MKLVIFDCDGVLVDSEPISNRILAADITAAGWPMSTAECIARFKGGRLTEIQKIVEAEIGRSLGAAWVDEHYERIFAAFREEITAIPGACEVLEALEAAHTRFCVASQGPVRKMRLTLGATGIWPLVEGHVYSATMVARPKPAPDLFLHAAATEGFAPPDCTVVEDSATGVQGAVAAGMEVIGYAADRADAPALAAAGARSIVFDMNDLTPLLK